MGRLRDPAPSRWRYRAQRLWLRPWVRTATLRGLPVIAVVAALGAWASDEARRRSFADGVEDALDVVRDRPEFSIDHLRIEGAGRQLRADIEETLAIDLPVSRFRLDVDGLRAGLEALDPVRSASVRVKSGGVLELRVVERVPAAAFMRDDGIDVLDAEGVRVATMELIEELGALPLIAGPGAEDAVPEALALWSASGPLRDRMVGLARMGGRRWDIVLGGDARIMLPEHAPVAALDRALALHAAEEVLDRDVAALDLRLRGRATVRMRPAAAAALVEARTEAKERKETDE